MTILIICIFCTVIFLFCSWVNTFGLEKINYESEEEINKIGLFFNKKINAFASFFVVFGFLILLVLYFVNKNDLKKDYLDNIKNSSVKFKNIDQSFFKKNNIDSTNLLTSDMQRINYEIFAISFQIISKKDTTNYKIVKSEEIKGNTFYLFHLTKNNKTETLLGKFIPEK